MLALSRKHDEVIDIADGLVRITIIRISQHVVRLGIEAPKGIPIHRGEVQAVRENIPETRSYLTEFVEK